jgi:hypothetical protein
MPMQRTAAIAIWLVAAGVAVAIAAQAAPCAPTQTDRRGNSGVNYRSAVVHDPVTPANRFAMRGYPFDLDGGRKHTGNNYEEKGRLFVRLKTWSDGTGSALGAPATPAGAVARQHRQHAGGDRTGGDADSRARPDPLAGSGAVHGRREQAAPGARPGSDQRQPWIVIPPADALDLRQEQTGAGADCRPRDHGVADDPGSARGPAGRSARPARLRQADALALGGRQQRPAGIGGLGLRSSSRRQDGQHHQDGRARPPSPPRSS